MDRTREETAEWVGYYFGLQRAGNLRVPAVSADQADGAGVAVNALRRLIQSEMNRVEAMLPPGTIDAWPRERGCEHWQPLGATSLDELATAMKALAK